MTAKMLSKQMLLQVLEDNKCVNQSDMLKHLAAAGVVTTQASLSRTLKKHGIARVPQDDGGYRWVDTFTIPSSSANDLNERISVLEDEVSRLAQCVDHLL